MNILLEKLKKFTKSNLEVQILQSSIAEIREVYKPQSQISKAKKLKYHIFNSLWNRIPNFEIQKVLKEKLNYAFRIGSGVSSYNQLPLSWIADSFYKGKNFLMKDRGHITTLLCWMYGIQFRVKVIQDVVNEVNRQFKSVDNWKHDHSLSKAIPILVEVSKYLESVLKDYMEKNALKSKDCKVSIKDICENVENFNQNLNHTPVSIEIRRESIWIHAREILGLNDMFNKWITFQKSFLGWCTKIMKADGSDNYLRNVLEIDKLRNIIDSLDGFLGKKTVLSSAVKNYKSKVAQYEEIAPLRLLSVRTYKKAYADRGSHYDETKEVNLISQLQSLSDNNLNYKEAEKQLKLANSIIDNPKWDEYSKLRKKLYDDGLKSQDLKNLEDAKIEKEDFGIACIDSIMELMDKYPGMKDRNPEDMISSTVIKFVDALKKRLQFVVDDETLFSQPKHMESRFRHIIKKAYNKVEDDIVSGQAETKPVLFEGQIAEIKPYLNGQTSFVGLLPAKESYKKPKIVKFDFSKPRKEAGLDLGKKEHTKGYQSGNVIAQIAIHNREADGDHKIDTISYWKWYSESNKKWVEDNQDWLIDEGNYEVLSDAKKLYNQFNK